MSENTESSLRAIIAARDTLSSFRPTGRRRRERAHAGADAAIAHTPAPAAAHFRAYVQLRSVDPARDRDRGDALTWPPALFDEGGALLRLWGRTGGPERARLDYYPDRAAAQAHVEALLRRRLRHGYRVLAWQ